MNDYIRICEVEKYYGNAANVTKAVGCVSFAVEKGEFVGVMGPSGSGKTTLLNLLATIDRVTAGPVSLSGIGRAETAVRLRPGYGEPA